MKKVAINGLGRIGRAALKIIQEKDELELIAVNDIVPIDNLVYLLKYDSVYGKYEKEVVARQDSIELAGKKIRVFDKKDPAELPWEDLEIDVVIESTGIFTDKNGLKKHIDAGAKKVILSAPAKSEEVVTIVKGVNDSDDQIISCASCTTNCITPVVEIISRRIGVKKAIMTTTHAYTSSQAIVDAPQKKMRRGRAGAVNIVPTSTGAAVATTKVLTDMKGKFDGVALRVPIPVGSIADLVFVTEKETSVDDVNNIFIEESKSDRYKDILGVSADPLVSSDIIKDPHASIVDLGMTQVVDGDLVKVLSWYDNEWGYAMQMVREIMD
jgi:glyceraldehyde 3-phosphate dehydrogenase